MLLRMAERAARNGGAYSARPTEIDRGWPRLSGDNCGWVSNDYWIISQCWIHKRWVWLH